MSFSSSLAPRVRSASRLGSLCRPFVSTNRLRAQEEWPQRTPLGDYYETILKNPQPSQFTEKKESPDAVTPEHLPESKKPADPAQEKRIPKRKPGRPPKNPSTTSAKAEPAASADTSPPVPTPPAMTAQEKARIIFGTRLASPDDKAARIANKTTNSSYIAGVLVPPQPQEPDNCCMSGCVNCVWDLFREDMEEWTAKKREAEARLNSHAGSMDADGGGSETNWTSSSVPPVNDAKIAKDLWDDGIFSNVPVGIREFMKQEKRLKEKHELEGTSGG